MLGDKIGSEQGKVTGRRILEGDDYRYVKMEVSFETEATILGLSGMNMGTYIVWERVPGQLYAEGRGIFESADGAGAIWNGHGIGRQTEGLGIAFAASVAFQTNAPQLEALNKALVLVEHHAGADGSASSTLYEWKA